MKLYLSFTKILLIVICSVYSVYAQVRYEVVELGTLGGSSTYVNDLNDRMQVVGTSKNNNEESRGFFWQNGTITDLGTLGGNISQALGINNSTQVVGLSLNEDNQYRAFIWENGNMTDLGTLGGPQSSAVDINNLSQVVGDAQNSDFSTHALIWQNGSMTDLGTLEGDVRSYAKAINDSGQVVGNSDDDNGTERIFLWQDGNMIEIGTFPGIQAYPNDINNESQVVGQYLTNPTGGGVAKAFLWQDGITTELGTLGGETSQAYGINDSGVVVGLSTDINNNQKACIWQDGEVIELNDLIDNSLGINLTKAYSINNKGAIVATGVFNENIRGYLLIPIRYPVLIVPGIAGTYASSTSADIGWILERGVNPLDLQIDPLGKVYNDIIKTFENVGYEQGKDLFVVNYDWRLLPGPIDGNIDGYIDGLTGSNITDNQFNYGVDYLGWYIRKASERWREDHDEDLDSIDIIAHSTGGLVTRTYIQSSAYGDTYDASNNYRLPKIRNYVMIGVPNRGASKAWNALHDNWIADVAYRFVLSKILNRAYQKVLQGLTITGPDYNITLNSIRDSSDSPSKELFINKYVPTIRGLLATYDFIDFGNGHTNVNNNPDESNTFVLDLNDGLDLNTSADPNKFLDSARVSVIYGTGVSTKNLVQQRSDFEILAVQSFTDWSPSNVSSGTIWYKDLSESNNGDGTVPIVSSAGQFQSDNRANKIPFSTGAHTELVSMTKVQNDILDLFNISFSENDISTGSSKDFGNILNVISDPVEMFITDGSGNRLGFSNSTGAVTEIPNSVWFGNTDGMGYVFGSLVEPISIQLTGLGENYYVMISIEDSGKSGGTVLEGFLTEGEQESYNITLEPLSVKQLNNKIPDSYQLDQNYPNPFNPATTIRFSIPKLSYVTLKIYDIIGNEIATLVNEERAAGNYEIEFEGSKLSSGVYFYRIQAGSYTQIKKMILLR